MCTAASSAEAAAPSMPTSSADQVLLGVLAEPLVGVDQAAGALVAHLAVVEVLVVGRSASS